MTNNSDRRARRRPAVAGFSFLALLCVASLAAQSPQTSQAPPTPTKPLRIRTPAPTGTSTAGRTIRLRIAATNNKGSATAEQETEFSFKGANGMVTGLSASSDQKTFKFERATSASDSGLSCPTNTAKECDSVSLKNGGKLIACGCLPAEPVTQTKEHILLARQVGVPAMTSEGSKPMNNVNGIAPAETSYGFALSDKSLLRATSGGQTCWVNKKLQMSICY